MDAEDRGLGRVVVADGIVRFPKSLMRAMRVMKVGVFLADVVEKVESEAQEVVESPRLNCPIHDSMNA